MMNGGCCGGAKFCVSMRTGVVNSYPCEVLLFRYGVPLRVRGSVWLRTRRAFPLRREARYRREVSMRQAAKRNGGGVFVISIVAGDGSRGHTGQTESGTRKGTWITRKRRFRCFRVFSQLRNRIAKICEKFENHAKMENKFNNRLLNYCALQKQCLDFQRIKFFSIVLTKAFFCCIFAT